MPTVRQRRVLEDLGITVWMDRASIAAGGAERGAAGGGAAGATRAGTAPGATAQPRRGTLPDELKALLAEEPPAARVRPPRSDRSAQLAAPGDASAAAAAAPLPAALGCLWVPGTLLLSDARLTPEDRRFCRDLLLAVAALETVDRASTSHRARLSAASKPQWLTVDAAELTTGSSEFGGAALGLLRKRIDTAAAQRLLVCGGPQGAGASWLAAAADLPLSDRLDPALAALGARLGAWARESRSLPVFVLPPIALLRAAPERKARLWRWLQEADAP
ncbi:MAG: hypothetical protein AAGG11_03160 [Pseudomonadota bacterium]